MFQSHLRALNRKEIADNFRFSYDDLYTNTKQEQKAIDILEIVFFSLRVSSRPIAVIGKTGVVPTFSRKSTPSVSAAAELSIFVFYAA